MNRNVIKAEKIIASALAGTSFMTLFSHLVSSSKNKNFREPDVLAKLVEGVFPALNKDSAATVGWSGHYGFGIALATAYAEIWKKTKIKPSLISGLLLGAASGLVGILTWKLTFKAHPHPPIKDLKNYFGHLMLAHLIFGAFSAVGYKLIKENKEMETDVAAFSGENF